MLLLDPDARPPRLRLDKARDEAELARLRVLLALEPPREDGLTLEPV